MRKTSDSTLAEAMRILSVEIQSDDGVANAAIYEAAERIMELSHQNRMLRQNCLELEASNEQVSEKSGQLIGLCIEACRSVLCLPIERASDDYRDGKEGAVFQCVSAIQGLYED